MSQCFPHLSLAFVHTAMRADKTKAKYMYLVPIYYVINYLSIYIQLHFEVQLVNKIFVDYFNFHRAFAFVGCAPL